MTSRIAGKTHVSRCTLLRLFVKNAAFFDSIPCDRSFCVLPSIGRAFEKSDAESALQVNRHGFILGMCVEPDCRKTFRACAIEGTTKVKARPAMWDRHSIQRPFNFVVYTRPASESEWISLTSFARPSANKIQSSRPCLNE
jgi:hypothetical protein